MTADAYLQRILAREAVDNGPFSPVRGVQNTLHPILSQWGSGFLVNVSPIGSFAKGTANRSGTDIDLFLSVAQNCPDTLKNIYESLCNKMTEHGYQPRRQNVSINVRVNALGVDLVPGKRQDNYGQDHSLWRRKAATWTKTHVLRHISYVQSAGRIPETRILKLWRNQKGLDFPSFYLEMVVIEALKWQYGSLSEKVLKVFTYLRDTFPSARFVDPANTNNIISEDLTNDEKAKIKTAAIYSLAASDWNQIVV